LGEEYKEKSIGIILSGTGTDGSRGIKTIKESGGVILVQDPLSAQFNGMPNAAIASGLAEFVAEPEAMAAVLQQIPNLDLATELSKNQSNDEIFSNILDEIKIYAGIDFKQYKKNTLVRRIEKRMSFEQYGCIAQLLSVVKSKCF
jgi:two-component system CheB/CheR fusion protein